MAKQRQPQTPPQHIAPAQAQRPVLSSVPQFVQLELEVEREYRAQMLAALEEKVNQVIERSREYVPTCLRCARLMGYHDSRRVSWIARFGRVVARVPRYRCSGCKTNRRPVLEQLGVEPGRISGSLARLLALLAVVAPYQLAAELAWLLLGVKISPMGIWRVTQRMGQAAARYSEELREYHSDSRSDPSIAQTAPGVVVLGVDGCVLGMQVRKNRRRLRSEEARGALPAVETGHFREVKTGVLLLPSERVETSPGRRSLVRRFLVSCLGDADTVFNDLWARLRELGWLGRHTVVVVIGDGAEWIWKRATMFPRRCEILDFWHAVEHAWEFARLCYPDGSKQAQRWVHRIAQDLRAGKVQSVISRLKRMRPGSPEARDSLKTLIHYYSENAVRMRYDEYLRLGYGIGSGAVESAHKQVVHARFRQAGMRWSEVGARRLLALRLLLLNREWELLDQLRMVSLVA